MPVGAREEITNKTGVFRKIFQGDMLKGTDSLKTPSFCEFFFNLCISEATFVQSTRMQDFQKKTHLNPAI